MRIIIVGYGRVGRSITDQLSEEGHLITVIDDNPVALAKAYDQEGIMPIEGNGASYEILKEAGVKSCDLLIAVTPTDELNLYTCLLAKNSGVGSTIARVRNPDYIHDIHRVQDDLKLSLAINPENTCASEIAKLVKFPGAVKIDSFAKGAIDLVKIKLTEKSPLVDKKVVDSSSILRGEVRIALVERGDECFIPNGDFVLENSDFIYVVAPSAVAAKLLKTLGLVSGRARSVIILGGSKIGYYLAKQLREASVSVKIIEKSQRRCEELSESLDGVMIICADAMDEDVLISEGIDRADGVVALMDTDEENILASLYVKKVNPNAKVITELGNLKFTSVFNNLPLDSVIRPKQLTGEKIVRYVRGMQNTVGSNVETMYKLHSGELEALEFKVEHTPGVTGVPLSQLNLKNALQIVTIHRKGKLIIPTGTSTLEAGDTVIVITKHKGLSDLRDILR